MYPEYPVPSMAMAKQSSIIAQVGLHPMKVMPNNPAAAPMKAKTVVPFLT